MTRDFLRNLNIENDLIQKIMDENGKDVEKAKGDADTVRQQLADKTQQLTERETEINGLKEQIAQRDADIKTLRESSEAGAGFKEKLQELQAKYDTDTKALNEKLTDQRVEFETSAATEKFFADVKFSSALAREAAVAQFKAKGFKLDNGTFQGGKEWLEELRKTAPDAFAKDEEPEGGKPQPTPTLPRFTGNIQQGSNGGQGGTPNPFSFNFTPLHPQTPSK